MSDLATELDRQDVRVEHASGLSGTLAEFGRRMRGGDLGSLPVIVGLVVIWTVFQIANPVFLSPDNLVNLTLELCSVGVISLGIVCVLIAGQIDLSVGSVSGLSGAILAVLFVNQGWPAALAVVAAVAAAALVGYVYAQMFNRLGMPSFVATLAGLLALLGLQLWILGAAGSINIPFTSGLVSFAQLWFLPPVVAYVLAAVPAAVVLGSGLRLAARRRAAGLSARSTTALLVRAGALLVVLELVAWYLNQSRGVGWMFVFFVLLTVALDYMLTRTAWGRSLFAVGGNAEAARRVGINVRMVYTSAFVLCSSLAAVGGILAASRLASANQSSGTGDVNLNAIAAAVIGGTSLFGGRGSAWSALLGVVVIQSISSGLTLLNLDSSFRFMITGLVLALAVAVDALARRSRASHGQA
ncbi:sugar ABC transporter permease [Pseudonocardia sp. CA-107938]|uniref:sugar ABC transporter permease n=1 Tax=Pseudonocardia sp. CA-107938 TaxID=3240021 RepID=UPI003D9179E1